MLYNGLGSYRKKIEFKKKKNKFCEIEVIGKKIEFKIK